MLWYATFRKDSRTTCSIKNKTLLIKTILFSFYVMFRFNKEIEITEIKWKQSSNISCAYSYIVLHLYRFSKKQHQQQQTHLYLSHVIVKLENTYARNSDV